MQVRFFSFSFPLVSQNLNNDLWSKLQGYVANMVMCVMYKGFHFLKWKKKSVLWNWHFSLRDEDINIEENPIPKDHLLCL